MWGGRAFTVDDLRQCPAGDDVRVAIVDSGVGAGLLGPGADERSFVVRQRGLLGAVERCEAGDVLSHGTAVASIVREVAPRASLTSVRVVDERGVGTPDGLRLALDFCVRERFDVVNVSLGTRQRDALLELYDLVDRAQVAGVALVAATDNRGPPDYPAACTSLVSVDGMASDDPFCLGFRPGHRVAFLARGRDVPVWSPQGQRRSVSGSSFACAHVSGFAARLLAWRRGLRPFEVKTLLHAAAVGAGGAVASPTGVTSTT